MNAQNQPDSMPVGRIDRSHEWNEHEHVSDQVQLDAQKLMESAGSPGLARQAIRKLERQMIAGEVREVDSTEGSASKQHEGVSSRAPANADFLAALKLFETALEMPVIPGELIDWSIEANTACQRVEELMRGQLQRIHAELYATILQEDPELAYRVEKLRENDYQLLNVDLSVVSQRLEELLKQSQLAGKDEASKMSFHARVVRQALTFVVDVRMQETAVTTWFCEAFVRDRGYGD